MHYYSRECMQGSLNQRLLEKFFEYHYNYPYIYTTAVELENINLGVRIETHDSNGEDIVYDEISKQYRELVCGTTITVMILT